MSVNQARQLRLNATKAERIFWNAVRAGRFMGLKFRRQHPIGRYVADFACLEQMLVIELDGSQHNPHVDAPRTAFLETAGYQVVRLWNVEILEDLDGALGKVADALGLYERYRGALLVTPDRPLPATFEFESRATPLPVPPPLGEGTPVRRFDPCDDRKADKGEGQA